MSKEAQWVRKSDVLTVQSQLISSRTSVTRDSPSRNHRKSMSTDDCQSVHTWSGVSMVPDAQYSMLSPNCRHVRK